MKKSLAVLVAMSFFAVMLAFAETNQPLAASVVTVKAPAVVADTALGTATEVYMELTNKGKVAHTVVAAMSRVARQTQLHRFIVVGGKQVMKQVRDIHLASHHETDLKSGGFHVMLMGIKKALKAGMDLPVTLIFEDGSNLVVNARVHKSA